MAVSDPAMKLCVSRETYSFSTYSARATLTVSKPTDCSSTVTPVTDPTQQIVSNAASSLTAAVTGLATCLSDLPTVDVTTGLDIASDFNLICAGLATPVKSTSGDYTVTVVCVATPTGLTVTVTADHERVYSPCIKTFIADLSGVSVTVVSNPTFTTAASAKRAVQDSSTTVTASSTIPGSAVCNTYGCSSATGVFGSLLVTVAMFLMYWF